MKQPEVTATGRMPAVYLGHGAPPLVDDPVWPGELARWSADLPRPKAILIVSAAVVPGFAVLALLPLAGMPYLVFCWIAWTAADHTVE